MLPSPLRQSLYAVHAVAAATLLRSVLYARWITVLVALVLLVGAAAAQRGKVWGIGLALGAAVAFPLAWILGIAPFWFCFVGAVGALPFALTSPALTRADAAATALGAAIATAAGTAGALAWGPAAVFLFKHFPAVASTWTASNWGATAALAIVLAAAGLHMSRSAPRSALAATGALSSARPRISAALPGVRWRVDGWAEGADADGERVDAAMARRAEVRSVQRVS